MLTRIVLFVCDLVAIGLAVVGAYLVGENFEVSTEDILALLPYVITTLLVGASSLLLFRLHRCVWWHSSLSDDLRICVISVFIVAIAMAVGFLGNRLQHVSRALPVIQVMLTALGLVGLRVAARLLFAWRHAKGEHALARPDFAREKRTVVLVGLNRVTMLYVRSVEEFASSTVRIAGVVSDHAGTQGRAFGRYPILGPLRDFDGIVSDLAVHGVYVTHICILVPRGALSREDFQKLSAAAKAHAVEIEFFVDKLTGASGEAPREERRKSLVGASAQARTNEQFWQYAHRTYWKVKRALDIAASATLICVCAPLFVALGLVVAYDVGLPVIFWQERPGARGRTFRVYKFRTMRGANSRDGRRLSDEERVSALGRTLRLCRLDELPQFFNVLVGDMSFVGPRPLLPVDQFPGLDARLAIAPGITGWAQVNGGRGISAADKAALDLWYLQNASLRVDLEIVLATLRILTKGEMTNHAAIERAWAALRMRRPNTTPNAPKSARTVAEPVQLGPSPAQSPAMK